MESDFAANLTEEKTQEADEAEEHEKITRENKVTKTLKELDVKYEILDLKSMDKVEVEYKHGMRLYRKKIEWTMFQDILASAIFGAKVVKFSKVSHPEKIADYGLSARTLTSTSL